eukprot:5338696-Pleurochrysis_carterae.AAC.1
MSEDSDDMDGEDESLDEDLEEGRQFFGNLPVPSWLRMSLTEAGFENPSPIQAAAMKRIAKGKDIIVHAATGSGTQLPLTAQHFPSQPQKMVSEIHRPLECSGMLGGVSFMACFVRLRFTKGVVPHPIAPSNSFALASCAACLALMAAICEPVCCFVLRRRRQDACVCGPASRDAA